MIYRHEMIYQGVMKALYGKHLSEKYQVVADRIPEGDSVLDICSGPASLYPFLKTGNQNKYLAIDCNPHFVRAMQKRNIPAQRSDAFETNLPTGFQSLTCLSSLYQLGPELQIFLSRLLTLAERQVILTEPIQNLSQSSSHWVRNLSKHLTRPLGTSRNYDGFRFEARTLNQELLPFEFAIEERRQLAKEREILIVLNAEKWRSWPR